MTQRTYDRILKEATWLFAQRGYSASSMRELANAVGIRKATLYHHVSSKEELLFQIMYRLAKQMHESIKPLLHNSEITSADKIRQALKIHFDSIATNRLEVTIAVLERRTLSGEYRQKVREAVTQYETDFQNLIAEGIKRGEVVDMDMAVATQAILSMCNSIVQWYSPSSGYSMDEIASMLTNIILRGILNNELKTR